MWSKERDVEQRQTTSFTLSNFLFKLSLHTNGTRGCFLIVVHKALLQPLPADSWLNGLFQSPGLVRCGCNDSKESSAPLMKVNLFGIFWHSDNNSNAETGGGEKNNTKRCQLCIYPYCWVGISSANWLKTSFYSLHVFLTGDWAWPAHRW